MFGSLKRPIIPSTSAPCAAELNFSVEADLRKVDFGFLVISAAVELNALPTPKTDGAPPQRFIEPVTTRLARKSYRFTRPAAGSITFKFFGANSGNIILYPLVSTHCALAQFETESKTNELLQLPTTSGTPTNFDFALSNLESNYLATNKAHEIGLELETISTNLIPVEIVSPKTRGRVFVRFSPVPLRNAGENAKKEASRRRSPDEDPFSALFYLLLAQKNWDIRVKGVDALLAAYPENKRPFAFQFEGIQFLASRSRALLADEMGLGKTIQAILAMRARIHAGIIQRVLIVCPKSLLPTWYNEISIWAPELSLTVVHGPSKTVAITRKHHVYITNYETVTRLICDENGVHNREIKPFDLLIVDEIQFLKNASAKKSIAVTGVNAKQRWALTGTPLENSFDDYRNVWKVINPAMSISRLSDKRFLSETKENVLRREKSAVLKDLPDKLCRIQLVELEGGQLERYRQLENAARRNAASILGMKPNDLRMHVLALLTKLKQQCIYDEESGMSAKLEWIRETLEEMHPNGVDHRQCEKALVFTQYPNLVCDKWKMPNFLKEYAPLRYDGSLAEADRIDFSNKFQTVERHRIAFISVKAGGTGLTLTRANQVIFLDQWWNPAVMEQAAARVHRIGQTRMCMITSLVAKDTVDERILKILERKQKLFERVMKEIREGKRSPEDLTKLENALTVDEMLEALGLSRSGK
ncbi:MAG: DEAD/DEAH box helicase [Planctomycetaceae bacterium]